MRLTVLAALGCAALLTGTATAEADCRDIERARERMSLAGAVPPQAAVAAAMSAAAGEMIRGRVCEADGGIVYEITLLGADGRVSRVTVDGASGAVIGVR